ncbi:hypothetical protein ACOMHN_017514 [Nucella lapillus]
MKPKERVTQCGHEYRDGDFLLTCCCVYSGKDSPSTIAATFNARSDLSEKMAEVKPTKVAVSRGRQLCPWANELNARADSEAHFLCDASWEDRD